MEEFIPTVYEVGRIVDEDNAFFTTKYLGLKYPNFTFEGTETGCGYYEIRVWGKYQEHIHNKTLKKLEKDLMEVSWVIRFCLDEITPKNK